MSAKEVYDYIFRSKKPLQDFKYSQEKELFARAEILNEEIFKDVLALSREILVKYPKNEYYIIGIGGSPTLIIAMLKEITENYVISLPLTIPKLPIFGSENSFPERYLTTFQKSELMTHFSKFLPTTRELGLRKIIVLDYTLSGDSLRISANEIRDYYKSKKPNLEIFNLALVESDIAADFIKRDIQKINFEIQNRWLFLPVCASLNRILFYQIEKPFAEYESYMVGLTDSSLLKPRIQFSELRDYYRKMLSGFYSYYK